MISIYALRAGRLFRGAILVGFSNRWPRERWQPGASFRCWHRLGLPRQSGHQ